MQIVHVITLKPITICNLFNQIKSLRSRKSFRNKTQCETTAGRYNVIVIKVDTPLGFAGGHTWNKLIELVVKSRIRLPWWRSSCYTNLIFWGNKEWLYCGTRLTSKLLAMKCIMWWTFLHTRHKVMLIGESI